MKSESVFILCIILISNAVACEKEFRLKKSDFPVLKAEQKKHKIKKIKTKNLEELASVSQILQDSDFLNEEIKNIKKNNISKEQQDSFSRKEECDLYSEESNLYSSENENHAVVKISSPHKNIILYIPEDCA